MSLISRFVKYRDILSVALRPRIVLRLMRKGRDVINRRPLFRKYALLKLEGEQGIDVKKTSELVELLDLKDEIFDGRSLLRSYVELKLRCHGPVDGENAADLVERFGLVGVASKTQLMDAIGSLQYKHKRIKVLRPASEHAGISDRPIRKYHVCRR